MEQLLFFQSFSFNEFHRVRYGYVDNRAGLQMHYIGYVKDGWVRMVTENEEIHVASGEFFYLPNRCRYESYWHGDPEICFDSFGFTYFPEPHMRTMPMQKIIATEEIRLLLAQLTANIQVSCQSVGLFYQLLGLLLPRMSAGRLPARQAAVEKAVRYMRLHPEIQVPELARFCGMSESSLYSAFQDNLRITPVEMKHQILSEKVVQLLTTTDEPVEAISSLLGFSSAAYLRKVLRKQTGKTPREIRKNAGL